MPNKTLENAIQWNLDKIKDPRSSDRDRARYKENIQRLKELNGVEEGRTA